MMKAVELGETPHISDPVSKNARQFVNYTIFTGLGQVLTHQSLLQIPILLGKKYIIFHM